MLVRELPDTGRESPAQGFRIESAAIVSFPSAGRRGLGCDWRSDRLLRNRAGLREIARTIRSSDCRLPIGAGKTGVDGAGNHQSATACPASYAHDGGGAGSAGTDLAG